MNKYSVVIKQGMVIGKTQSLPVKLKDILHDVT